MNLEEIIISVVNDVNKISKKKDYNRYIKKYPVEKMFMFLLYQQFSSVDNGRAFTVYLKNMIGNTTETISQSELSKKLSYRLDHKFFKEIYNTLLFRVKDLRSKERRKLEKIIRIIDSTALEATDTMNYARHRKNKNGFKMHTLIDGVYLPEDIRLKNGRSSDKKSLKWAVKSGYIHIFDRGYNDYSQFKWIEDQNAYFVTRALANIKYTTVRNRKVGRNQKSYGIESDKIIEVIEDRETGNTFQMRLVTFRFIDSTGTEQHFSLLSNLMNCRSDVVAKFYRERWNIEVVFRWIKTFLNIDHWMSRSKNGVLVQIYSALCAYLIALMAKLTNPEKFRIMKDCIYEYIKVFKRILRFYEQGSNIEDFLLNSG
jgi:hypothetical protein